MKTPYDAALRAIGRDVDDLRTSVGDAVRRLAELEARHQSLADAIVRESKLAAGDRTFSPAAYLARAHAEREQLSEASRAADAELEALRLQTIERYGSLRAIQGAADTYRGEAGRAAAAAEQTSVDDFAGARFARALLLARHARRQKRVAR